VPYLIFVGVVSSIFGIIFLFYPGFLRRTNKSISSYMSKVLVNFDEKIYNLRVGIGVCCILVSVMAFYTVYYLIKRYG